MSIDFDSIKDSGNIEKERIILKVTQACDLGKYMLAISKEITEQTFSSNLQNLYWFPDKELKLGDLVVLYTKKGEKGNTINEDGSTTYFYYWGLSTSLSKLEEKPCVVLLESTWKSLTVPQPEPPSEIKSESK